MNEQLIVKNFGPIKDATVDFKRVTVFIGPTGGGKSTLAKLAAVFRDDKLFTTNRGAILNLFTEFALGNFFTKNSRLSFNDSIDTYVIHKVKLSVSGESYQAHEEDLKKISDDFFQMFKSNNEYLIKTKSKSEFYKKAITKINEEAKRIFAEQLREEIIEKHLITYIPSERIFLSSIEYSWPGIIRDDIGLPKLLIDFANRLSVARKNILEINIPFFDAKYIHQNGQDFIQIPEVKKPFRLYETASGIQSVTPLLVLLEHLSRNTEQAQSFIIEEPELNLYPTAQQGLLNWLVEKCTQGENDLTITTHSPYILSSCNLLLEAYKVAQLRPDLEDEIAAIVPKACWLNPDEFAAYYVADGTVKPITDERTHLIGGNELDAVSGDISDSFRKLLRLQKQKQPTA